jgi:hypothetical protein
MSNKTQAAKGASWLLETILLSICLEHGKMIEEIFGRVKDVSWPVFDAVNQPPIRITNPVAVAGICTRLRGWVFSLREGRPGVS